MFGFGKSKKETSLQAPVDGQVIQLSDVNDPVFSGGTMGYGFAVQPTGTTVTAPVSGELIMLFKTNHAFAVRAEDGAEVLVHIGVDTVSLKGEGFTPLVEKGAQVTAGQPIVEFDPALKDHSKVASMDVIVVVTNGKDFEPSSVDTAATGDQAVMTLKKK